MEIMLFLPPCSSPTSPLLKPMQMYHTFQLMGETFLKEINLLGEKNPPPFLVKYWISSCHHQRLKMDKMYPWSWLFLICA